MHGNPCRWPRGHRFWQVGYRCRNRGWMQTYGDRELTQYPRKAKKGTQPDAPFLILVLYQR
ncbi:MAG: hypothetical protein COB39_12600 [Marinosulfonomonas sp.]|nr:MAG: hypothetical protein COB39_12600 [Marinosulfonomonas sp.]